MLAISFMSMTAKSRINGLGLKIQHHLEQHRPKLYRSLQESGKLKAYVLQQQNEAEAELDSLEESGLRPDEAMERIQSQIFPPSEEDLPNLNVPSLASWASSWRSAAPSSRSLVVNRSTPGKPKPTNNSGPRKT
jgi:hypothetical protein